ncbi:MAG: hypothetical protein LBS81_00275 [Endomicrobium sp.]|nr:hypothetical protein [Endomicrobium sp.]
MLTRYIYELYARGCRNGENNNSPSAEIVGKAMKIAEVINAEAIYNKMIAANVAETVITIQGEQVAVKHFNTMDQLIKKSQAENI